MRATHRTVGAVAGAGLLAISLALTGCGPAQSGGQASRAEASATAKAPAPSPVLVLPQGQVAFDSPLHLTVTGGKLSSLRVTRVTGVSDADSVQSVKSTELPGRVDDATASWTSDTLPVPGAAYTVAATALDADGTPQHLSGALTVAAVPAARGLAVTITPFGGTVGVGAPVVLRFSKDVADRAAIENLVKVSSSTPVLGGWRWISGSELHYRPETFWPTGTTVEVSVPLLNQRIGEDQWGTSDSRVHFVIGRSRITKVSGASHTMTLTVAGKSVATWPTSLGRPEFQTRTGTYVVLGKASSIQMTSCSAQITCDKNDSNYYDLKVDWDVRLTNSGTFIHAAPWSQAHQGRDNVSHGCINLSQSHGHAYFEQAQLGDVVIVTGTGRGPADLLRSGDPGMADWNMPLADFVKGSATGAPVNTEALAVLPANDAAPASAG